MHHFPALESLCIQYHWGGCHLRAHGGAPPREGEGERLLPHMASCAASAWLPAPGKPCGQRPGPCECAAMLVWSRRPGRALACLGIEGPAEDAACEHTRGHSEQRPRERIIAVINCTDTRFERQDGPRVGQPQTRGPAAAAETPRRCCKALGAHAAAQVAAAHWA